ncbi:hypothetical protein ACFQDN_23245 [Pseudomonas asuensis]|uniref:Uncharacterized protein n=1 Tax=Pseudomonas asuensis TaxID=1825787 RepID=A0ABQ2H3H8_9PSED|nr:hypothetical protein [Pseudomonas asuensis]GGM32057.1 hypothetical protein GCM10009425_48270 [Pseudomonas asuensis]
MSPLPKVSYQPFDVGRYTRSEVLTDTERDVLANRHYRSDWLYLQQAAPKLVKPLLDLVEHSDVSRPMAVQCIAAILWQVSKTDRPYWV